MTRVIIEIDASPARAVQLVETALARQMGELDKAVPPARHEYTVVGTQPVPADRDAVEEVALAFYADDLYLPVEAVRRRVANNEYGIPVDYLRKAKQYVTAFNICASIR